MESIISLLNQGLSTIVPFIVLLGFLIFVHELGHFLVAKWCGVRVEVFSLGFGKKILKRKYGDTVYCISLIPLGGYVKMFGDEIGAKISSDEKKFSFTHKNVWQRIAVVVAGPLMNFFFAILVFGIVAYLGEEVRSAKIGDIEQETAAYKDGFRSGDKIVSVNGSVTKTWDEFQEIVSNNYNQQLTVDVSREGSDKVDHLQTKATLKQNQNPLSLREFVGEVDGLSFLSKAAVVGVLHKSAAQIMGFRTGDRIASMNGKEVLYFRELENLFVPLQGQDVTFVVERLEGKDGKDSKQVKISGKIPQFSSLAVFGLESSDLYLSKVVEKSPAEVAGLKANDKVLAVNNIRNKKWDDILSSMKGFDGKGTISITIERDGEEKVFSIEPKMTSHMTQHGSEEKRFTIGIMPWILNATPATLIISNKNLFSAGARGAKRTLDVTVMTVVSFLRLLQAKISPKNIGGVLTIGQAASETFKIGVTHFLQLMAVLSVNLFILNLLPIPVLDGGHLLFYSIEALRGAPLSMRKLEIAQQVGLVVLMSLMALSLFNDFSRILGFW